MHRTRPKVFLVGETRVTPGFQSYLNHIGAPEWETNAPSEGEYLVEAMGRLCYRSWKPHMNANVTKVREGNDLYLANIIKSGHGSVLEHAQTNWIFADVSRVFTHELVRHRVGTAISQESLRYVRLTDLGLWLPQELEGDPVLRALFEDTFKDLEALQLRMAEMLELDKEGTNFERKKRFTSAMRRLAPIGLSTTIGFSMNFRTLRHLLVMRTARHAEVEMRVVFNEVGWVAKNHWPNIVADFTVAEIDGIGEWTTPHAKV